MSFWTGFLWITCLYFVMGALYIALKRHLNHAQFNRILILGIFVTPLFVWIPIPASLLNVSALATITLPEVKLGVEMVNQSTRFDWPLLYLGISGLFLIFKFRGLVKISRWSRYAEKDSQDGLTVYRSPNIPMPCSFFGNIFIPHGLSKKNEAWIIAHEQGHSRQFHSADLLFTNLISSLFWINPLVHLLQKELTLNHEYLADEEVLKTKGNTQEYMNIMVASALKTSPEVFTHSFSIHSHLKNRIKHMHQTKRSIRIYWLWIPFIAVLLGWAACNQKESTPEEARETVKETPLDAAQVDQMPEMEGGMEALMTFLSSEIVYPESQKEEGKEARVMVRFTVLADGSISEVVALPGRDEVAKEFTDEAIRAVLSLPKWKPGMKDGKPVAVQLVLPIRFAL